MYRETHSANSALLFIDLDLCNGGAMTVAMTEVRGARKYTHGVAIVLGVLVIFAFTMFLVAAAPGKQIHAANGSEGVEPVSGLGNLYNMNNVQCALQQYCDLTGK